MIIKAPPIKSQGIKTKLVPWINSIIPPDFGGRWIEPFMGTGAVAFNIAPHRALLCDTNPHLINFYQAVMRDEVTGETVRAFLNKEGATLLEKGDSHYYKIRERFNRDHQPLDFLFLNRAGFNGMIRFNRKGGLNTPFCRKPQRFAKAYVTKIVNQINHVSMILKTKDFKFKYQSFNETISESGNDDIIYCDPPYINRHADYYGSWEESQETALHQTLSQTASRFILSTWHHNRHRKNNYIEMLLENYHVLTREHYYHVGGSEKNRNPMVEALVVNYDPLLYQNREAERQEQLVLLETNRTYRASH